MDFDEIVVRTGRLDFPALTAGKGRDVVCWHGFPDHPMTFAPLAEHLVAAGRRVVLPFLRGFHPTTFDALTYSDGVTLAADAAAVGEALGGVDMIGHDIGAGMVYRVAAAWPELTNRGVTIAIPPPGAVARALLDPSQQQRLFYMFMFTVEGVAEAILRKDRALVDYLWATWSPSLTLDDAYRTWIHAMYGKDEYIESVLKVYRANFDSSRADPALAEYAKRTEGVAEKPLLVLGGAEDGCLDPRYFTEDGLAPGSKVEVLPGVGHFLHLERPEAVAKLVLEWFGQ
ncbi:alpha/beta fold hydrolase [Actinophytocola oryzae]|uniref:Pimeloyl-ACP methyl ester carboxylesterase n=1 Tax=Actinophytocola oryzae TaxID=502181 RepID=A0A4R7VRL4_9PSEU|nr:alpha/beta hydrolase [Actinophytocola oryzae]TDV52374.1 pimeloyl-ACP methyl ester carboxylesterase [Actinophytocola oryzae]